jgi:hypothetical protein
VIDRNVLGDPTCLLGTVLGVGVDPTDAPYRPVRAAPVDGDPHTVRRGQDRKQVIKQLCKHLAEDDNRNHQDQAQRESVYSSIPAMTPTV